jgi:hypothetical protein
VRDSIDLTAALINPGNVSGTVDATGCNIGIYYGPGQKGNVSKAAVSGANYFGIVNDGANVNISGSDIHNIGEVPFNGDQHGVGIYFAYDTGASGSILDNTVSLYQKGGIVVNGGTDSSQIVGNTVTGNGPVDYIAQNGIQVGYGAHANVILNKVTGNAYTGLNDASSTGILVFGGCGDPMITNVSVSGNIVRNNDIGIYLVNNPETDATCSLPPTTPTNDTIDLNLLTDSAVTNVSGNLPGSPPGFQAGIYEFGDGDSIFLNAIAGVGYTDTASTTALVTPIYTSGSINLRSHLNLIF